MFNFRYEDGFKINNNNFPAISRVLYLSTETISKPPQSHETIPLIEKGPIYLLADVLAMDNSTVGAATRFLRIFSEITYIKTVGNSTLLKIY
jgi:hypothetical protein